MPSSSAVNGGIGCDNSGTVDSGTAMNVSRNTLTRGSRGVRSDI